MALRPRKRNAARYLNRRSLVAGASLPGTDSLLRVTLADLLRAVPVPTCLTRAHCPVLDCSHVINARRVDAAVEALQDHIARCHGSLVQTT